MEFFTGELSPDLAETRIASEQFVSDLGKGNDLDGVITIDITFFQKLLDKWGGVEVPGEDEIITGQNIYEKFSKCTENLLQVLHKNNFPS